jgi:hypothetical protein
MITRFFNCIAFTAVLFACSESSGEDKIVFNRDIRPILSNKCFACHGPNGKDIEADLRLDTPDGQYGALTPRGDYSIIKPGSLEDSELWYRISTDDIDERMPTEASHKTPLTPDQLALFKQWIIEGGGYQDFWAFVPPLRSRTVDINDESWRQNPIDHIVAARLEKQGLQPKDRADRRTLIRRVTFDLTGLPPTVVQIHEFLNDKGPDAYPRLVDRLLEQKSYGEHMARYWADLVRLSDSNGMHKDFHREFFAYRDWLIRSFNDNMPFGDFIKYQLAGDLYEDPSRDQLVASGFNRLHLIIDRGTALPEESLHKNVVDRVRAFGTTFLGLTVQCAQCHDHKYDPITQKDYYQLYAFFNNFGGNAETVNRPSRGLQPPFINLTTPAHDKQIEQNEAEIQAVEGQLRKHKEEWAKQVEEAEDSEKTQTPKVAEYEADSALTKHLSALKNKHKSYMATIPGAMHMSERSDVRVATMLIGGAYNAPDAQVERNTPGFLLPLKKNADLASRMDLAEWLVDPNHPLTARVAVNRIWQQLFGVGIVKTSEDLGAQGEWPSHPQLLDELAVQFVASEWDVKSLIRQIVLSRTYQQGSDAKTEEFINDPENRLLARGSRYRMDAELIRDQILLVSGLLNTQMYGKSVKPPQPPGLWKMVSMIGEVYRADPGDQIYRRSLYTYWKRGIPPPQMTIMNAPFRDACVTRRERTNTPLQALLMMNEQEYFKAAKACAKLTLKATDDTGQGLILTYEKITSHQPDAKRLKLLEETLQSFIDLYQNDKLLTEQLTPELQESDFNDRVNVAAWTMLTHSLLNLELCKVRR